MTTEMAALNALTACVRISSDCRGAGGAQGARSPWSCVKSHFQARRAQSTHLRVPMTVFARLSVVAVVLTLACASEQPIVEPSQLQRDGKALEGRHLSDLPVHEALGPALVTPARGRSCRIIVVGSSACPYSRSLAVGWNDDMRARLEGAGVEAQRIWVIYGDSAGRRSMLSRGAWGGTEVHELVGGVLEAATAVGVSGVPQTLLVDSTGTIRSVVSGNLLLPTGALRDACLPMPVRRE
jgi:hypothetical protein